MTFFKNVLAPVIGVGIIAGVLAAEVLPLIGALFFVVGGGYFMNLIYGKLKKTKDEYEILNDEAFDLKESLLESKQLNYRYENTINIMHSDALADKETIQHLTKELESHEQSKEAAKSPAKSTTKSTTKAKTTKKSTK